MKFLDGSEQAMTSMDNVLGVLRSKLDELGAEIKRLTSEQLNTGPDNAEDLKKSRKAIEVHDGFMSTLV
jgi:hypothetical protein